MHITPIDIGLFAIFVFLLVGPFVLKIIERNLEAFLFLMGVLAVTTAGVWHIRLIREALLEPIVKGIVPAVMVAGLLFHYGRRFADRQVNALLRKVPLKLVVFGIVVALGLASSIITAIIASLLLVELMHLLPLDHRTRVNLVIIACFSIGLGAALTPLGEPLSTIAITKLQGEPYHARFFFLFQLLGSYIIPGVLAMGIVSLFFTKSKITAVEELAPEKEEPLKEVWIRALRVYLFIVALILLGGGFKIIIDKYFTRLCAEVLFWLNTVSAILDNATLTAAEIAPSLHLAQIKSALMSLIISGGMLIPGNIPNIISAHKLRIRSREWARLGIPLGLVMMVAYFAIIFILRF